MKHISDLLKFSIVVFVCCVNYEGRVAGQEYSDADIQKLKDHVLEIKRYISRLQGNDAKFFDEAIDAINNNKIAREVVDNITQKVEAGKACQEEYITLLNERAKKLKLHFERPEQLIHTKLRILEARLEDIRGKLQTVGDSTVVNEWENVLRLYSFLQQEANSLKLERQAYLQKNNLNGLVEKYIKDPINVCLNNL